MDDPLGRELSGFHLQSTVVFEGNELILKRYNAQEKLSAQTTKNQLFIVKKMFKFSFKVTFMKKDFFYLNVYILQSHKIVKGSMIIFIIK